MPLTTTLTAMRDAVYRTSDTLSFTVKHPTARVNDLINQGIGALSRICRTTNPEFQPIGTTTVTADGVATMYALPTNFRSLLMVQYTDSDDRNSWLTPYELAEHAALTTPETVSDATRALAYRLVGSNIELLPRPPAGDTAQLWYATTVTQLTGDTSAFDTMDRLDSYVIWWAAREIAFERENWERHDRLTAKMAGLEADIRILARSLDLAPTRVTDLAFSSGPRWRRYRPWNSR